jgi:hypothetical protein
MTDKLFGKFYLYGVFSKFPGGDLDQIYWFRKISDPDFEFSERRK